MNNFYKLILMMLLVVSIGFADDAEFQTVVSRNDMSNGGEFHLEVQMRITSGTSPRTLNSLTVDVYYGAELTEWAGADPSENWAFDFLDGYSTSANKNTGYYRLLVTGPNVNASSGGVPPGWDVTTSWQTICTLKWTIDQTTSVNISISDATDAAAYFDNYNNNPLGGATSWNVSNTDLGDTTLPVELSALSATIDGKTVVISWTTRSEVNNLGYNILRSDDNNEFEIINAQMIKGAGSSVKETNYSFADTQVESGLNYSYKLEQVDQSGLKGYHGPITISTENMLPKEFALSPNYPNPFNPTTSMNYQVPKDSNVEIIVFDMLGKTIKTLVSANQKAGYHTAQWNGTNDYGNRTASGIYFVHMKAEGFTQVQKMTLMK